MRGETFVTRKITRAVAAIRMELQEALWLGNLDAKRDWGHARDYVEGTWRIGQHDCGDDLVLATNVTHTVRAFVDKAFGHVDTQIDWSGDGVDEVGGCRQTGRALVCVDPGYFPPEVELLIGDASKARHLLGWQATTTLDELCAVSLGEAMRTLAADPAAADAMGRQGRRVALDRFGWRVIAARMVAAYGQLL